MDYEDFQKLRFLVDKEIGLKDEELKFLFHQLFKRTKADYTDRGAWMRTAMYWKAMCMAIFSAGRSENLDKLYSKAMASDQIRSPHESELKQAMMYLVQYIKTKEKEDEKPKSNLIVSPLQ